MLTLCSLFCGPRGHTVTCFTLVSHLFYFFSSSSFCVCVCWFKHEPHRCNTIVMCPGAKMDTTHLSNHIATMSNIRNNCNVIMLRLIELMMLMIMAPMTASHWCCWLSSIVIVWTLYFSILTFKPQKNANFGFYDVAMVRFNCSISFATILRFIVQFS